MPASDHERGRRELASAKLTRTLRVVGRRDDGYHLLEAEMVSVDLADELEFEPPAAGDGDEVLEVLDAVDWLPRTARRPATASDNAVPKGGANLVVKALAMIDRRSRVRLTKRIPAGAGLGGGSSDAAAVLRHFGVLDPSLAVRLGADVPFCLRGGRALVGGVGEEVQPLPFLRATVLLCTPPIGVSTALVYRAFDEIGTPGCSGPNDLEAAALAVEPALARWRDLIGGVAGRTPALAGSGSTWFLECAAGTGSRLKEELEAAIGEEGERAAVSLVQTTEAASA